MTILFVDGFDHYDDDGFEAKYDRVNLSPTIDIGNGRNGTNAASINSSEYIAKNVAIGDRVIVGVAFRCASLINSTLIFVETHHGQSVTLNINSTGSFDVGTTTTETGLWGIDTWNYIEIHVYSNNDPLVGYIEFRLNGAIIEKSFQDIGDPDNNLITEVRLTNTSATAVLFDDYYILDPNTGTSFDYLGNIFIDTIYADGTTATSDFSVTGAASNNAAVSAEPQDESSYVSSSTVGDKDLYTYETPSVELGTPIYGVQVNNYVKKDNAGLREYKNLYGNTVTTTTGSPTYYVGDDYRFDTEIQEREPISDSNWTDASLIDAEFGVEIT